MGLLDRWKTKQETDTGPPPTVSSLVFDHAEDAASQKPSSPSPELAAKAAPAEKPPVQQSVVSRRSGPRSAERAVPIDMGQLKYIRLPKAPYSWEERASGAARPREEADLGQPSPAPPPASRFVLSEGMELVSEVKLAANERPDTAYKKMYPTVERTIWIDPKGERASFVSAPAVALVTDRTGARLAERALSHNVYRTDVNGDGSGMLFLSREGVLHGYSETVDPLILEQVADIPEYRAQAERFAIGPDELKNHTRCVAISTDRSRYLLTIVDEAWCYDRQTNRPLWGLRFPAKDGWTEVATERSERVGTSAEIDTALRLIGLALPVGPEDITRQYRKLALAWHPDHNPQHPGATRRFQDLGAAVELLIGADLSRLSARQVEQVTYQQVLHRESIVVGGQSLTLTFAMQLTGAFGRDWIYAADFAGMGHGSFLAGYSGRVLEVNESGLPGRVYDIGAVPRQVVDSPPYLYILTDTRLYVLQQDRLEALLDVYNQGNLIVGSAGFGLLQSKSFRWLSPNGQPLASVETHDPIRRILSSSSGLVVDTSSHRATITGASPWW